MAHRFENYLGKTDYIQSDVSPEKVRKLGTYGVIALSVLGVALASTIVSPEAASGAKGAFEAVGNVFNWVFHEALSKPAVWGGIIAGTIGTLVAIAGKSRIFYDGVPLNSIAFYQNKFDGLWRESPTQATVYGPSFFPRFFVWKKMEGTLDGRRNIGNRFEVEGLRVAGSRTDKDGVERRLNFKVPALYSYHIPPEQALSARRRAGQGGNGKLDTIVQRAIDFVLSATYADLSTKDVGLISAETVLDQDDRPIIAKELRLIQSTYDKLYDAKNRDALLAEIARTSPRHHSSLKMLLSLPVRIDDLALENAILSRDVTLAQNEVVAVSEQAQIYDGVRGVVGTNLADNLSSALLIAAQGGNLPVTLDGLGDTVRTVLSALPSNSNGHKANSGEEVQGEIVLSDIMKKKQIAQAITIKAVSDRVDETKKKRGTGPIWLNRRSEDQ